MFDLSSYLDSQLQGEVVEEGVDFSLDAETVAQKLAPFQKELPAYGLLVFAQALVKLKARYLSLDFRDGIIALESGGSFRPSLLEEIEQAFHANRVFGKGEASYFARALRCLMSQGPEALSLSHNGSAFIVEGEGQKNPAEGTALLRLEGRGLGGSSFKRLKKEFAERAVFLPCDVKIGGESLKRTLSRRPSNSESDSPLQDYLELIKPGSGFLYAVEEMREFQSCGDVLIREAVEMSSLKSDVGPVIYAGLASDHESSSVAANMVLCLNLPREETAPGYIIAVSDGVFIEVIPERSLPAETVAIVDVTALRKDLSGFKVVADESFARLREEVLAATDEAVAISREHFPEAFRKFIGALFAAQGKALNIQKDGCLMRLVSLFFDVENKFKDIQNQAVSKLDTVSDKELKRLESWRQNRELKP